MDIDTATEPGGFALPAALLALVIVGALVTGGVYAAMEEDRSSANMQHGSHAFMAAERGLEDLLGTRNRLYFQDSVGAVGKSDTIGPEAVTVDGVQARYTVYVQRLNTRLFKVDSEGEVVGAGRYAGSKRRLSEFMRITYTLVPKDRAVTSYGPLRMRGKSGIVGVDSMPATWDDCEDVGTQAAVQAHNDHNKYIDIQGNPGLVGSPQVRVDASMDSMDFIEYGDMNIEELKTYADINLPPSGPNYNPYPVVTGGVCDRSVNTNWGDPKDKTSVCHTYWPIIYVPGNLHASNGYGQGILIVDGDLHATGAFEFNGLVFVYGGLTFTGSGNHFAGSVNIWSSGDTTDIDNQGAGISQIRLSSCAIERAHTYSERFSRPFPLAERKFIDMSGLGVN